MLTESSAGAGKLERSFNFTVFDKPARQLQTLRRAERVPEFRR